MPSLARLWYRWTSVVLAGSLCVLAGCSDEPVRTYETAHVPQRMLALIIPTRESTWFLKFMGEKAAVTAAANDFWAFARSIKIDESAVEPLSATAPSTWQREAGREMRYATYRLPNGLEIAVFRFGPEAGTIPDNINRWRKQLKLGEMNRDDVKRLKTEMIDGRRAFAIDLESARSDGIDVDRITVPRVQVGLEYKTPPGWVDVSGDGKKVRAEFRIEKGESVGKVTIMPLRGAAGGVEANINRWREEVGLPKLDGDAIESSAKKIELDGVDAQYWDLDGTGQRRMLGVICPTADYTWFVKFIGQSDLVAGQKSAFEELLKSIRLPGEK